MRCATRSRPGSTCSARTGSRRRAAKAPEVPGARWQLIGPLQSNKARRALEVFEAIQSVDSVDLAARLDRLVPEVRPGGRYPILLQVNVDLDPAKAGFAPADLDAALEACSPCRTCGRRPDDGRPADGRPGRGARRRSATFRDFRAMRGALARPRAGPVDGDERRLRARRSRRERPSSGSAGRCSGASSHPRGGSHTHAEPAAGG